MDARELRRWCLAQSGAVEDFPFTPEHSVFKVAGKMFALSALERTPLEVSVKCEPDIAVGLRNSYDAIRPGHRAPQAADHVVLLERDHGAGAGDRARDRDGVERLQRGEVEDRRADAERRQAIGSVERLVEDRAGGGEGDVVALADGHGAT